MWLAGGSLAGAVEDPDSAGPSDTLRRALGPKSLGLGRPLVLCPLQAPAGSQAERPSPPRGPGSVPDAWRGDSGRRWDRTPEDVGPAWVSDVSREAVTPDLAQQHSPQIPATQALNPPGTRRAGGDAWAGEGPYLATNISPFHSHSNLPRVRGTRRRRFDIMFALKAKGSSPHLRHFLHRITCTRSIPYTDNYAANSKKTFLYSAGVY